MYNHRVIEKKWIKYWINNKTFYTNLNDLIKKKFYAVSFFSMPINNIYVNSIKGYIIIDIICRYYRMNGYNVWNTVCFNRENVDNGDVYNILNRMGFSYDLVNDIKELFCDKDLLNYWLPIDLLYDNSNSFHFIFRNSNLNNSLIVKRVISGTILGDNGIKMSHYNNNTVKSIDVINEYGADTLRLHEMFMGPIKDDLVWNTDGIDAMEKFIYRVFRLYVESNKIRNEHNNNLVKIYNKTVKKVSEDYNKLAFNTAISQMMIFINAVYKEKVFPLEYALNFLKLLNPICPFITEELYSRLNSFKHSICNSKWPTYVESAIFDKDYELVVFVNGKIRGKVMMKIGTSIEYMKKEAFKIPNVLKYINMNEILDIIVIKDKIVNILIK